jgi:hypothetical protein
VQEVKVDAGPEVNAGQEVELEVDGGPEVNSVQALEVDGGQGLDRGQGLEVHGRQEVKVDGEQDVDGGQEVNRRQRRVGEEYAGAGYTSRASCLLPPEPSTSSRAFNRLQIFQPPPELRAGCLRSLRPPPERLTSSTAFDRLQSFLPSPELRAVLPSLLYAA